MKKRSSRSEPKMMEDKDAKCLYQRLPKKKLQDLCNGYGLSPYTNKANLVESLFAYFKASGLNVHQILNNVSSSFESVKTTKRTGPNIQERVPLIRKRRNSHNVSENNKKDGNCKMKSSKFINEDNNVTSRRKVEANGSSPIEISPSKVPSKDIIPSFHFSVSCDEGINLVVDLNSNPNDWVKRMGDETHYFPPTQNKISGSFRAELELIGNSSKMKDKFPNFNAGDLCDDKGRLSSQLTALSTTTIVSHDLSEDMVLQMPCDDNKSHPQNRVKGFPESSISVPSETKSTSEVIDSTGDAQFTE